MVIRLTPDEAWYVIAACHTGILTTLRRDGTPVTLPVWFVVDQHTIGMMTPSGTKKVSRIRRDPRATFLVEAGQRWEELRAVHLTGRVEMVEDPDAIAPIATALDGKYAAFRPDTLALSAQTRAYYANQIFLPLYARRANADLGQCANHAGEDVMRGSAVGYRASSRVLQELRE